VLAVTSLNLFFYRGRHDAHSVAPGKTGVFPVRYRDFRVRRMMTSGGVTPVREQHSL
jgi:hypothetical protein